MSIVRTKRNRNFTVIPNEIINDPDLSGDLLGLLVYLLSKPDDWKILIKGLSKGGRFGSHEKLTKSLGRLRSLGYATMQRHRDGTTTWIIYDEKRDKPPHSENPNKGHEPDSENPNEAPGAASEDESHIPKTGIRHEMPHSDFPHSENPNVLQRTEDLPKTEVNTEREEEDARAQISQDGLPEWLPADLWRAYKRDVWEEERGRLMPISVQQACISSLAGYMVAGHDPIQILQNAVSGGWVNFKANESTKKAPGGYQPNPRAHQQERGHYEAHRRFDNSAPGRIERAYAEKRAREAAQSAGTGNDSGEAIDASPGDYRIAY